jgi:hypothetical protein
VIIEHESHSSPQALVRQHESKLGVETLIPLEAEPWPEQALGKHREEQRGGVEEKNLRIARRYHHGMARQCSRGHNGTKPGEGVDVTSAKHHTHQHQISPRRRPSGSRSSSRSPWPRSRASEEKETRAPGGNRLDLADREERHRGIYRLRPISVADSSGARRNRARRWRGDTVARARAREEEEASEGGATDRFDRCHLVGPGRPAPTGGPSPTGGPGLVGERERIFNQFKNRNLNRE